MTIAFRQTHETEFAAFLNLTETWKANPFIYFAQELTLEDGQPRAIQTVKLLTSQSN